MSEEVELTRRQRRYARIKARITNPVDIKFRGPLTYRYLRIIAWIAFALGQMLVLGEMFTRFFGWDFLGTGGYYTVNAIYSVAAPLFIVASFGITLSGQKTFKQLIIGYGLIFLGMFVGLNIFYYRYLLGIFATEGKAEIILNHLSFITKANVFTDLFMFALFHYFVNYQPKKFFRGKKIIIFRFLVAIPVIYVIAAYLLKVFNGLEYIHLPFVVLPLLTTKSPFVFGVFALVSIWLKRRRKFLEKKVGLTYDEYHTYLKSNRNSLSFSCHLSGIIGVFGTIELIAILITIFTVSRESLASTLDVMDTLSIGDVATGIMAIPFIMLYSYTRKHKNKMIDPFLPFAGIGMAIIVYLEVILAFMQQVVYAP